MLATWHLLILFLHDVQGVSFHNQIIFVIWTHGGREFTEYP